MLTVTLDQITSKVTEYRRVSARQVRRYITACNIKPIGARQCPQQYPPDTAERVLSHLGLAPLDTAARRVEGIPSMAALRTERKKARGK